MNPTAEKPPLDELLSVDDPEGYCETLNRFYEAWTASEHSNGTTPEQRSLVLTRFKSLRKFLFRIREKKKLQNCATDENVWIS